MGVHNWEIAICDDEPLMANQIKEICESFLATQSDSGQCSVFTHPEALLQSERTFDLLFLDVEMPEMEGFEVAKALRIRGKQTLIIFLTSHQHRMAEAFHVKAFRYLSKPIHAQDICVAMQDAMEEIRTTTRVLIQEKGRDVVLETNDIVYVEAAGEGTIIHTSNENYMMRDSLKKWRKVLPEERFFQTHKAFIVNLSYVKSVGQKMLLLTTGLEIPLSRRQRKEFSHAMHIFIRKYGK